MPEYVLRGVSVHFPHDAYDCQLQYMDKVIQALQEGTNALLESPTGTGKTLCLLCATLAWRESLKASNINAQAERNAEAEAGEVAIHEKKHQTWADAMRDIGSVVNENKGLPTIIYSSRTHSQLAQVMGELRKTSYRPRTTVLGSRSQLCLHPSISKMPTAASNQACRAAVSSRSCSWYNKVEPFLQKNPDTNHEPLEIEELMKLGQSRGPCPFYLAREMSRSADLVFMPYNYLIDAKLRGGPAKLLTFENSIIIFDEAHNVESVCSEAGSFDLPASLLAGCIIDARGAYEVACKRRENSAPGHVQGDKSNEPNYYEVAADMKVLEGLLSALENAICAIDVPANGFTAPGLFLFELLSKVGVDSMEKAFMLVRKLEAAAELLAEDAADASGRARATSQRLPTLADMLRTAFETAEPSNPEEPAPCTSYRVHVHLEKGRKGGEATKTVSYWCFLPGLAMQTLARLKVRSFLLTSGTLAPLASFAAELQLPFPITLENRHVIDASQVWVGVVGLGPLGAPLNSSYQNRDNQSYKEDLGRALSNFARMVPDGLLVFFPSYIVMQACIDSWKSTLPGGSAGTIWESITKLKQPVIEPRESAMFQQAADDFRKKLDDPSSSGAIFFAVCKGKVSEGLDFSDRAGRAVVITGIPFANARDARVLLKKEVLDEVARRDGGAKRGREGSQVRGLTGDQWYKQNATRAVNQGMGRVIRHRNDYGAIILADERFQADHMQKQLSAWLRPLVQMHPHFGSAARSLSTFFRERAAASAAAPPPPRKPRGPVRNAAFSGAGTSRGGRASGGVRGLDRLLTGMQVPSAMDASGLAHMHVAGKPLVPDQAELADGASRLMGAIHAGASTSAPTDKVASGAAARPQETGSLADSLWAALDGNSRPPASQLRTPPEQQTLAPRASSAPGQAARPPIPASRPQQASQSMQLQQSRRASAELLKSRSSQTDQPTSRSQPVGAGGARQTVQAGMNRQTEVQVGTREQDGSRLRSSGDGSQREGRGAARGTAAAAEKLPKPSAREQSKQYFQSLAAELPADEFKKLKELLLDYKAGRVSSHGLMDGAMEVLRAPGRRHLLTGFSAFVPKADKAWFARCVRGVLDGGGSSQGPLPIRPPPDASQELPGGQSPDTGEAASHQPDIREASEPPHPESSRGHGGSGKEDDSRLKDGPAKRQAPSQLGGGNLAALQMPLQPGRVVGAIRGQPGSGVGVGPRQGIGNSLKPRRSGPNAMAQTLQRPASQAANGGGRQGAGGGLPVLQEKAVKPNGGSLPAPASQKAAVWAAGPACMVCNKAGMTHPYEARCGHIACFGCWVKVLGKKAECPTCRKPTQRRQLVFKYFA